MTLTYNLLLAFRKLSGDDALTIVALLIARDPNLAAELLKVEAPAPADGPVENVADLYSAAYKLWVVDNQKVEAIKLIRNTLGIPLKEAKDKGVAWFDHLKPLHESPSRVLFPRGPVKCQQYLGDGQYAEPTMVEGVSVETYRVVMDFLARGNKIEAIKELRRKTGCGLKDAKDAVEYWDIGAGQ